MQAHSVSLDASDEDSAPPQVISREAHVKEIRRLIRLSDGIDSSVDAGLDYFAVQGEQDRAKLEGRVA
jgi:hypothetical protein